MYKELLIKFLDWYYKEGQKNPMRFETDNEDIAMMFLQEEFPSPKELEAFERKFKNQKSERLPK